MTLVASRDYAVDADRLATELDQPIYGCVYAAVAVREEATFVTADKRFARKLEKRKIDVAAFA